MTHFSMRWDLHLLHFCKQSSESGGKKLKTVSMWRNYRQNPSSVTDTVYEYALSLTIVVGLCQDRCNGPSVFPT